VNTEWPAVFILPVLKSLPQVSFNLWKLFGDALALFLFTQQLARVTPLSLGSFGHQS
jgi:hypothetical protein